MIRKVARNFLIVILALSALAMHAQATGKPAPEFKLTLSFLQITTSGQILLEGIYTNTSGNIASGRACAELGYFYLEIVYNGVDVTKGYPQKTGPRGALPCKSSGSRMAESPNDSVNDFLYYRPDKPGTYEFTLLQDTYPDDPSKNITVKSNTITVVVPEPKPAKTS